jgi:hypothetical protein
MARQPLGVELGTIRSWPPCSNSNGGRTCAGLVDRVREAPGGRGV